MFYHQQLLSKTGKLSLIWIAGHFKSRKLSKKRILESDLVQICEDLAQHIKLFALPVRASLVLGASIVCLKKSEYLKRDVQDLEKRMAMRGKALEVQIDMREVPEHRRSRMVIERPKFPGLKLTADLLDIDFGLLDQPAPEIDYEQMRLHTADEAAITLREPVITRKPPQSEELVADFMEDHTAAFREAQLDRERLGPELAAVIGRISESFAGLEPPGDISGGPPPFSPGLGPSPDLNVPPTRLSFEEAAQEPAAADVTRSVFAVPRVPSVAGRLRRKKIKVDTHTKITSEELGKRLGNPRIATRKREDVFLNWEMIERNKVESRFREIGRGLLGKGLTKFIKNQKRDFDRWVPIDKKDPFAWADSGREPTRMAEQAVPTDHVSAVGDASMFDASRGPGSAAGQLSMVHSPLMPPQSFDFNLPELPPVERPGTEGRAENGEPVAKRPRAELSEAQLLRRYSLCGAFMEQRFQQKAKRNVASFADLMDGNNRKKVARCLHFILKKASEGRITVEQSEPYGPILIKKTNPNLSFEG